MSQPNTSQHPRHDCVTEIEYSCKTTGCWFQDTLVTTTTSFPNQLGGVGMVATGRVPYWWCSMWPVAASHCIHYTLSTLELHLYLLSTLYTLSTIYCGAAPIMVKSSVMSSSRSSLSKRCGCEFSFDMVTWHMTCLQSGWFTIRTNIGPHL